MLVAAQLEDQKVGDVLQSIKEELIEHSVKYKASAANDNKNLVRAWLGLGKISETIKSASQKVVGDETDAVRALQIARATFVSR